MRAADGERRQDAPSENDVRDVLSERHHEIDRGNDDETVVGTEEQYEQDDAHEIEREADAAFEIEASQSVQHTTEDAPRHADRHVDSQDQRRDLSLPKIIAGPTAPPGSSRCQDSRQNQRHNPHHRVDRQHQRDDFVDPLQIPFRMVLRDVAADRVAEPEVEQPRVSRDGIDEQPTAIGRNAENIQRVSSQKEPDHQVGGVRSPTREDVSFH